ERIWHVRTALGGRTTAREGVEGARARPNRYDSERGAAALWTHHWQTATPNGTVYPDSQPAREVDWRLRGIDFDPEGASGADLRQFQDDDQRACSRSQWTTRFEPIHGALTTGSWRRGAIVTAADPSPSSRFAAHRLRGAESHPDGARLWP